MLHMCVLIRFLGTAISIAACWVTIGLIISHPVPTTQRGTRLICIEAAEQWITHTSYVI